MTVGWLWNNGSVRDGSRRLRRRLISVYQDRRVDGGTVRVQLGTENGGNMKRGPDEDTMRSEYEFSSGVRGKRYEAYRRGTKLILLEPDVAAVFKDSVAVNAVLRALAQVAHAHSPTATDQ